MSLLKRLFAREKPNIVMRPLYNAIVAEGRRPDWYNRGAVPDTIDGRFDMIAVILCFVLIRLEEDEDYKQESAWLTELFVGDMDGQLRQIGIGDMVVGKHIGRMMGALGGRLGAYRAAFQGKADLKEALVRNLYRGEEPVSHALDHAVTSLRHYYQKLEETRPGDVTSGQLPETEG